LRGGGGIGWSCRFRYRPGAAEGDIEQGGRNLLLAHCDGLAGLVCLLSAQEKNAARATPILGPPPRLLAEHRIVATLIMLAAARLIPVAALLLTRDALMTAPHTVLSGG
jgi:hypothetical protein